MNEVVFQWLELIYKKFDPRRYRRDLKYRIDFKNSADGLNKNVPKLTLQNLFFGHLEPGEANPKAPFLGASTLLYSCIDCY